MLLRGWVLVFVRVHVFSSQFSSGAGVGVEAEVEAILQDVQHQSHAWQRYSSPPAHVVVAHCSVL